MDDIDDLDNPTSGSMSLDTQLGLCECCGAEPAVGHASVSSFPMTINWGRKCLEAGVIPYWAAVAQGVLAGGVDDDHMVAWAREEILRTLTYFNKTFRDYTEEMQAGIADMHKAAAMEPGTQAPIGWFDPAATIDDGKFGDWALCNRCGSSKEDYDAATADGFPCPNEGCPFRGL